MKNASRKAVRSRLRKFLQGAARARPEALDGGGDPMVVLIESVLEADAPRKASAAASQSLLQGFVDLNELRVATPREMAARWTADFPDAIAKAQTLGRVLNAVFERSYQMSLDHLKDVPRRDLRAHLLGLGLSPYASARLLLVLFEQPAVPVDASLVEAMELDGLLPRGATVADVQGLLERLVPARGALATHDFLRSYVEGHLPALQRRRRKAARATARAERLAAQARAKAQALERAQARAQEQATAKARVRQAQARKVRAHRTRADRLRRAPRNST